MKKKIGIGIIGTGFARRTQIPAFSALENAVIRSVASGGVENAKSTAAEFGIEHFTDNWRETVERDDVDLVCITTPPSLHLEMVTHALENGKHVLCEKPMSMNIGEAAQMTRLAAGKGLMAIIDHELRFTKGRQKAFDLIRDGKIGKIRHSKFLFQNAARGDANLPWTWWSDLDQGGGALGAISSHFIDTLRWLTGSEISDVFCRLHTHVKNRPFEGKLREVTADDETMMILRFGESEFVEDATATVSISVVEAGPYRNRVEFYGTSGALRIDDGGEIHFADITENVWEPIKIDLGPVAEGMPVNGWSRGFTVLSELIVNALAEGRSTVEGAATFEDGLAVQKVLDAARQSDREGRFVFIG